MQLTKLIFQVVFRHCFSRFLRQYGSGIQYKPMEYDNISGYSQQVPEVLKLFSFGLFLQQQCYQQFPPFVFQLYNKMPVDLQTNHKLCANQ